MWYQIIGGVTMGKQYQVYRIVIDFVNGGVYSKDVLSINKFRAFDKLVSYGSLCLKNIASWDAETISNNIII